MDETNAIMYGTVDKEDYWVHSIVFPTKHTNHYDETYESLVDKLESADVVKRVINEWSLLDDLFEGDDSYKFKETKQDIFGLHYFFENSQGDQTQFSLQQDYTFIYQDN